ncbi:MAG: GNAT family N-acetyltransferase [bacterium]
MISVRRMREEDIPRVSSILCSCYRWLAQREGFSGDELKGLLEVRGSEETVRKESREELYFVANKKQTIVGMVAVKKNEITKLYVEPAYHGQGVGTALFHAAERAVIAGKYSEMTLAAIGASPIPFYQGLGMSVVGYKQGRSGRKIALMKKWIM